jgi:hypothetical protein
MHLQVMNTGSSSSKEFSHQSISGNGKRWAREGKWGKIEIFKKRTVTRIMERMMQSKKGL